MSAIIYTQQISRQFQLDMDRHNALYAPIDVETFRLSHDRFLCTDDDVYHIGASIKDLGKKWFGFSKMEILTPDELVERINKRIIHTNFKKKNLIHKYKVSNEKDLDFSDGDAQHRFFYRL